MDRITKYTVTAAVYRTSLESAVYQTELEVKVNALIDKGWQPFGSLQLVARADALIALQPMVRMGSDDGGAPAAKGEAAGTA